MNRFISITAAAALAVAAFSAPVKAGDGGAVAAGVIGGLAAGALIGGAVANSQPRYYAPPPPAPVYVRPAPAYVEEEPACRMVRQRYWDGYGYRMRRMEVCD